MRNAPPSRPTLRRRVISALTERVPVKLAALFLAFVLWLVVSGEEPTEEFVPVELALSVDSGVVLRGTAPDIRALAIGRGRDVLKLWDRETPLRVRRRITDATPDSVVLALDAADIDIPPGVAAVVRDVQPRTIKLYFDVLGRRTVPVRLAMRIRPDNGFRLTGEPSVEPERATVLGPLRIVRAIDSLLTSRIELVARDTAAYLVALDTAGLGVSVTPSHVRVRVPVERATPP